MIPSVIGSIREAFSPGSWAQWFEQLDRTFVFLLVLPFVVAIVGLWAAYRDRERDEAESPSAERRRGPGRRSTDARQQRDPDRFLGRTPGNLTE